MVIELVRKENVAHVLQERAFKMQDAIFKILKR